jgi:hypothetical protein
MAEQPHLEALKDQRVRLPGHFEGVVTVEAVRALGAGFEVRVRLVSGALEETVLSASEFDAQRGQPILLTRNDWLKAK